MVWTTVDGEFQETFTQGLHCRLVSFSASFVLPKYPESLLLNPPKLFATYFSGPSKEHGLAEQRTSSEHGILAQFNQTPLKCQGKLGNVMSSPTIPLESHKAVSFPQSADPSKCIYTTGDLGYNRPTPGLEGSARCPASQQLSLLEIRILAKRIKANASAELVELVLFSDTCCEVMHDQQAFYITQQWPHSMGDVSSQRWVGLQSCCCFPSI